MLTTTAGSGEAVALQLRDVNRLFETKKGELVQALDGIDLQIHTGQVLAILGPSGCGKSSLLRILAGLDREYNGEIAWAMDGERDGRLQAALVFQQDSTLPWLTVQQNVRLGMAGIRTKQETFAGRIERYLSLVGLTEFKHAYPHELSGGMRQRVAIARALATEPLLLLMDEPLAPLDAQTKLVMQQELIRIWGQIGATVVYITHDIEEALTVADSVAVMTKRPGRIKHFEPGYRKNGMQTASVAELRSKQEFREAAVRLWNLIAVEVGTTLEGRERPGA